MMRFVLAAALLAAPSFLAADLLPEALGEFTRGDLQTHTPEDQALYDEFGLEEAETAVYRTSNGSSATVVAQQFYDDTGAFSAFRWEQNGEGVYSGYGERSWTNDASTLIHFANYLVKISGEMPLDDHIELMLAFFPRVRPTPDPPVLSLRPSDGLRAGSEKHILGPVGLEKVAPEIPPSAAGFHFGSEAHFAEYDTESGPQRMLLFSYPTPQMARVQADEFYKLNNVVAKRTGPIIAAVAAPASPDDAQRLLARVRYAAEVTMDYTEANKPISITDVVLDTFVLVAILAGLCIVGGIFVAGARYLAGRVAPNSIFAAPEGDGMIHLGIDEPDEKQAFRRGR